MTSWKAKFYYNIIQKRYFENFSYILCTLIVESSGTFGVCNNENTLLQIYDCSTQYYDFFYFYPCLCDLEL